MQAKSLGVGTNSPASIRAIAADSSDSSSPTSSRPKSVVTGASGRSRNEYTTSTSSAPDAEGCRARRRAVGADTRSRRPLRDRGRRGRSSCSRQPLPARRHARRCRSARAEARRRARTRTAARPRPFAQALCQLGIAIGIDEAADSGQLVVGDRRIPAADEGDVRVGQLEQTVRGISDLRRRKATAAPLGPSGAARAARRAVRRSSGRNNARTAPGPSTRAAGRGATAAAAPPRAPAAGSRARPAPAAAARTARAGRRCRRRPAQPPPTAAAGRSTRTRNVASSRTSSTGSSASAKLLLAVEPREDPADRRLAPFAHRAGDDQPLDRAGHRDVVEAEALLVLGCSLGLPCRLGEREKLVGRVRPGPFAAGVGDDDHLELEPLRGVDRQQPHRTGALLLGDRLELRSAERLLVADEPEEALEVAPAQLLVGAREPHQLAQVRRIAAARPSARARRGRSRARKRRARTSARATRAPTRRRAARSAA